MTANVFVIAFGMSWGPVVWVCWARCSPTASAPPRSPLAAGAQWVANWIITVSFPPLKDISLGLAYGFYALCAILSIFFVIKWVRETKGRELEDMDSLLDSEVACLTARATHGRAP